MDIQVTLTLANSSQTYSSSCSFKRLWAELFFQLHTVVLTPVLCNCWTVIDVCEKSIFCCQSRALSCTCKANTQGCHPGLGNECCSCKGTSTFGSELNPLWPNHRQCTSRWREGHNESEQRILQDTPSLSHQETPHSWNTHPRKGLGLLLITLCAALWQIQIKACKR